jgi:uncharacterized protein
VRVRRDFPRPFREIRNAWIPLGDGCRLAARIWLPEDAEADPVPAILEYIPYRKSDGTVARDALLHPYFAGHGYASVRVDMRGSGDSDGVLLDEYLPQEQDDALEVLRWLAGQPWCNGAVGMIGKSWGGFNALQVAARRPPELEAIVTVCSTDDRYTDDVHYIGGSVLAAKMLPWASTMLGLNALPPDPEVVGERWRAMWLERLERTPPFVETWLAHQRRDAYWRHGSVCEDFSAITCPVYAVGGWADPYSNAIPRLLAGLACPRKGLIGPWAHQYPQSGVPGPAIGFLQECLRWWDYWLKDVDTGIMEEPMLRVWMQEWVEPRPFYAERPGRWVAEESWPSAKLDRRPYALADRSLVAGEGEEHRLDWTGAHACGLDAGEWCPAGGPADLPSDQQREDGLSLSFDSEPLAERLELLGFPELTLALAADRPLALVALRLCVVAPHGPSLLVARGVVNLSHREGHEHPHPLEPGRRYTVRVRLSATAQVLPAGHRLRLAVSPTYWPWAWPSPEPVTLSVFTGSGSRLDLPIRRPGPEDGRLRSFEPPEGAPPLRAGSRIADPGSVRVIERDLSTGQLVLIRRTHDLRRLPDEGLERERLRVETCSIVEGDPLSASVRSESMLRLERDGWEIRIETRSHMTSEPDRFHLTNSVDAFEGSARVFANARTFTVPRDAV